MTRCVLTALLTVASFSSASAQTVRIDSILASPESFDGQHVTVTGTVAALRIRTSQKGNPYETFNLCDGRCVHVFTFGQPASITNGSRATVSGTYSAVKRVGRYTFRNEVDADRGSLR